MTILAAAVLLGQIEYEQLPGYRRPESQRSQPAANPFDNPPEQAVTAQRVPDTTDWVAWAVQDLLLRPAQDRPFIRYLAVPSWGTVKWHQANSLLVNSAISQSSNIVLPDGAAGGWLIVWDLRRLAPKDSDLARLLVNWNSLFVDEPYFHVELPRALAVACRSYVHSDGKTYNARRFVPAPQVAEGYAILENETLSFTPLLRADDFLRRVSSTIDGGSYYNFIGFVRDGKRLSEAEIFKTVGLDVVLSREVEGDDRAAVFQSAVTAKPRMIEQVQGAVGKARITLDVFDEDVTADRHPIYELLDMVNRARGKEIIFERPNGLFGYVLVDGAGKLVDVAPPNLVSDHRTPEPVTRQLFPPLSCIRCHGASGGIQNVRNDVPALLAGGQQGDLDVFDDLSSKASRIATVDRLAGLFAATDKFQGDLDSSRLRYADAVFAATRGMSVDADNKPHVAPAAAEEIAAQFADYWYPRSATEPNVSPDRAVLELGYSVPAGQGARFLQETIKPGRVDVLIDGRPVEFADPAAAALRRGMSIRRQDFTRIYAPLAFQILEARKATKARLKP